MAPLSYYWLISFIYLVIARKERKDIIRLVTGIFLHNRNYSGSALKSVFRHFLSYFIFPYFQTD